MKSEQATYGRLMAADEAVVVAAETARLFVAEFVDCPDLASEVSQWVLCSSEPCCHVFGVCGPLLHIRTVGHLQLFVTVEGKESPVKFKLRIS